MSWAQKKCYFIFLRRPLPPNLSSPPLPKGYPRPSHVPKRSSTQLLASTLSPDAILDTFAILDQNYRQRYPCTNSPPRLSSCPLPAEVILLPASGRSYPHPGSPLKIFSPPPCAKANRQNYLRVLLSPATCQCCPRPGSPLNLLFPSPGSPQNYPLLHRLLR